MAQGIGASAIQRLFSTRFQNQSPSRYPIRLWYNDFLTRGYHEYQRRIGRLQILDSVKQRIRNMFRNDPMVPIRYIAFQVGAHHTIFWKSIR